MNILITGGSGFLGRYVARQFKQIGYNVTVLGRNEQPFLKKEGIHFLKGDICEAKEMVDLLKNFNEVHHIAAKTGININKDVFYKTNVIGTKNIINACLKNKIHKLIYASSASVVYKEDNQTFINETFEYPNKYTDYYSKTKSNAEQLILNASNKENLLTLSLRHHLLWGPEDTNLLPRIIKRHLKNKLFIVGSGKNYSDFTYVENAAYAHILASQKLNNIISGNAFFITNNSPLNLWDFINTILLKLGFNKITKKISYKLAYKIGYIIEKTYETLQIKKEPLMTRFLANQLHYSHTYSTEKAKTILGYSPKISVDEGLERLIAYYNKNINMLIEN